MRVAVLVGEWLILLVTAGLGLLTLVFAALAVWDGLQYVAAGATYSSGFSSFPAVKASEALSGHLGRAAQAGAGFGILHLLAGIRARLG